MFMAYLEGHTLPAFRVPVSMARVCYIEKVATLPKKEDMTQLAACNIEEIELQISARQMQSAAASTHLHKPAVVNGRVTHDTKQSPIYPTCSHDTFQPEPASFIAAIPLPET